MAARTSASLPGMRLGGQPVEDGQNALMVRGFGFFSLLYKPFDRFFVCEIDAIL